MSYVAVKEESEERLHFIREPSLRSWAIFVGLVSVGLGAAYYSGDYLFWKISYVSGTVFVGLTCLEDWEECLLDKNAKKITTKKTSLIQKLFQTEQGQKIVIGELDECVSVSVIQEEVKYAGIGYIVVLHFDTGYQITVTETAVIGDNSEQKLVADKIRQFLALDVVETPEDVPLVDVELPPVVSVETAAAEASDVTVTTAETVTREEFPEGDTGAALSQPSSSDSDDSFEQIDKAELANICEIALNTAEVTSGSEGLTPEDSINTSLGSELTGGSVDEAPGAIPDACSEQAGELSSPQGGESEPGALGDEVGALGGEPGALGGEVDALGGEPGAPGSEG